MVLPKAVNTFAKPEINTASTNAAASVYRPSKSQSTSKGVTSYTTVQVSAITNVTVAPSTSSNRLRSETTSRLAVVGQGMADPLLEDAKR